jgi:predicted MFS family arabinose efflux permease
MSIRQSAIPAGFMLAGVVVPILVTYSSWHALLWVSLASVGLAILLVPTLPWLNDRGSAPTAECRMLDLVQRVLAMPGMRQILFAIFTCMMMGACLRSFLTAYLVRDLGLDLVTAGLAYSVSQLAGIAGQLACAVASDRWVSPRTVVAVNSTLTTVAALLAACFTRDWPMAAVLTVAMTLGFNSFGCLPVMLGEVTRRSPENQVGAMVSGAYLFVIAGCAVGPLCFGAAGTLFGYSGALALLAFFTCVGAIVAAPLSLFPSRNRTRCQLDRIDGSADAFYTARVARDRIGTIQ